MGGQSFMDLTVCKMEAHKMIQRPPLGVLLLALALWLSPLRWNAQEGPQPQG